MFDYYYCYCYFWNNYIWILGFWLISQFQVDTAQCYHTSQIDRNFFIKYYHIQLLYFNTTKEFIFYSKIRIRKKRRRISSQPFRCIHWNWIMADIIRVMSLAFGFTNKRNKPRNTGFSNISCTDVEHLIIFKKEHVTLSVIQVITSFS